MMHPIVNSCLIDAKACVMGESSGYNIRTSGGNSVSSKSSRCYFMNVYITRSNFPITIVQSNDWKSECSFRRN